jgi:hypothetical protein
VENRRWLANELQTALDKEIAVRQSDSLKPEYANVNLLCKDIGINFRGRNMTLPSATKFEKIFWSLRKDHPEIFTTAPSRTKVQNIIKFLNDKYK